LNSLRVFIVDEHESVRTALAERLCHAEKIEILGHTGHADKIVPEIERTTPDIVLLEVKRSDGLGLELLRQLSALPYAPKLVVLTTYQSSWERDAATRAGAIQYLLKDIDPDELIERLSMIIDVK
jgi:DNA-binding NarL/FixJ family response regulator